MAVLPFASLTPDEASQRLAGGLTEDIITDLARFPEFQVIARNSTKIYTDEPADPREVGAALNASFVVQGSIARQTDQMRITARVVDATSGSSLWSNRWDRPDHDFFAIQTEISEELANHLGGGAGLVQEAGRRAARRKSPGRLTAYEFYLLGTEKLEQMTRPQVEEAVGILNRALALDPGFARAWVELHHSHHVLARLGAEPEKNTKLAVDAAETAVRLDPEDAEARAVYAMSLAERNDLARAKAEFDAALRLAPNAAEILTFYSGWASSFGEAERGAQAVDRVVRLDPNFPMWSARFYAYAYFMVGRYDDVLRMLDRFATDTYTATMWALHPAALAAVGRTKEARIWVEKALEAHPQLTIEAVVNRPARSDADRQRLIETMRLAGFPPCAAPDVLTGVDQPFRLPECLSGEISAQQR